MSNHEKPIADVKAIGLQGVTPRLVLETINKEIDEIQDLVAVGFLKNGNPVVYASPILTSRLALAALMIQDQAIQATYGDEEE